MGKRPDDRRNAAAGRSRTVRIAYTLNNTQPVRCSIIGEEPLFYMDYEGDIEDEIAFDDPFCIEDIELGLEALAEKIAVAEIDEFGTAGFATAELVDGFHEARVQFAEPSGGQHTANVESLVRMIGKSRLGASYLECAAQNGTRILYSRQAETAHYDRQTGLILVNPDMGEADRILLAVRELRRCWQHRNGALVHPLTFLPDHSILVNRAQNADLAVSMVRIAWELQLAGENAAWDRIDASSMSDLGRAFARESCLDFRSINNGLAAAAVFETWFLSERCSHEDRILIQHMLADYQGHVFESEEPSRTVTAELITALGSMPFGKNYLAPYVNTVMTDPLFIEVRDRSNANFLWFIKFERSFRETEQELQTHESVRRRDLPPGALNQKNKRRIGDDATKENIIALPGGRAGSGDHFPQGKRPVTGSGSNIIRFPHLSGKR